MDRLKGTFTGSSKSADDKVLFQVQHHFVDDYQHYPNEDQRFIIKHENHEIAYSLCRLEKYWSEMIAEDEEVTIHIKHQSSKNDPRNVTNGSLAGQNPTDPTPMNSSTRNAPKDEPKNPICKSSWITHMMSTDQQMYNSVRDYVV